jgi:hypothetical protein
MGWKAKCAGRAPGAYFARFRAEGFAATDRLVILRQVLTRPLVEGDHLPHGEVVTLSRRPFHITGSAQACRFSVFLMHRGATVHHLVGIADVVYGAPRSCR